MLILLNILGGLVGENIPGAPALPDIAGPDPQAYYVDTWGNSAIFAIIIFAAGIVVGYTLGSLRREREHIKNLERINSILPDKAQ